MDLQMQIEQLQERIQYSLDDELPDLQTELETLQAELTEQQQQQNACQHPPDSVVELTDDNDHGVSIGLYCTLCYAEFQELTA